MGYPLTQLVPFLDTLLADTFAPSLFATHHTPNGVVLFPVLPPRDLRQNLVSTDNTAAPPARSRFGFSR